ncbi:M28 family metallopeptidase [Nocardia arthritidis]|uniref:Carboxypeptidase Q n=1 Tax=Nocardia arthritidis TaxID=228602 RepID=A0A6G9YSC9_9NOCA|nr:M28 family peptidase [Nocardia arthritidis]QIS15793.1 M28 family peptidase [Nocardia arthritidis]
MPNDRTDGVPTEQTIASWIEQLVELGIRRPGYPADDAAAAAIADHLRTFGLEDVRLEPISVPHWEPVDWSLRATPAGGEPRDLPCFPLPFSAPTPGIEAELAAFDAEQPHSTAGKVALCEIEMLSAPADLLVTAGSAPADPAGRVYDPDDTLAGTTQLLPFSPAWHDVMEPAAAAGAVAFIGGLTGYIGDSYEYYVPYDAKARPIPGVWVRASDAAWLRAQLGVGSVHVRLEIESNTGTRQSSNVVGELPGADAERVIIGSHHDGPWESAVEDASGVALVLAQAAYWARRPAEKRPHRLIFVLHGGHMAGLAGPRAYVAAHRAELDATVLELHLEHAALEYRQTADGDYLPTGLPEPRWFCTSRIPVLERAVSDAIVANDLRRSMILAPDAVGAHPPTDAGHYHDAGVPVVNFITTPAYLFDRMDRLDKIDFAGLVPLTRAAIRIIESTAGIGAAEMRERMIR